MKKIITGILVVLTLGFMSCTSEKTEVKTFTYPEGSPVAIHGRLQVNGLQLCDKNGEPVQLAGMSTAGWHWFGNCYTRASFESMRDDWHVNIIRLAMYVDEGGYNKQPKRFEKMLCNLIDICGELGIYCIVDWHILTPGNPWHEKYREAQNFFRHISKKYAYADHVLYEICNEPNNCQEKGDRTQPWVCTKDSLVTWEMISEYANTIIPIIHNSADEAHQPHPVVICGTPQWDQLVNACLREGMYQGNEKDINDPLPKRDARLKYDNVMYTFHFYASSHNEGFEKDGKSDFYNMYEYMYDVLGELPVFCTEYGTTMADGNGEVSLDRTDKWLLMFRGNNAGNQYVSFCNWSYADKDETSSALQPGSCWKHNWADASYSGDYIKRVMGVVNAGIPDTSVLKPCNIYVKQGVASNDTVTATVVETPSTDGNTGATVANDTVTGN